jgi:hypothetical protein
VAPVVTRLQDPDADVRRNLLGILGAVGDQSTVTALTPQKPTASGVATAATYAIDRIKMSGR